MALTEHILIEHINDIRDRLKDGGYITEKSISNQIVIRLLKELGWPIFDEWTVIFEYPVGNNKKVDLALCCPRAKSVIFIEVKAFERFLDKAELKKAKKQLSEYISYFQNDSGQEIPIAILIDGQKWLFFHPTGEGNWKEKPVCKLDFIEGDTEKTAEYLHRYLNYESICTDKVAQVIKDDYLNANIHIQEDKAFSHRLRVTMPNGEVIDYQNPEDTFAEVIIKLGVEKVASFRPKIVKKSLDDKDDKDKFRKHNGFLY